MNNPFSFSFCRTLRAGVLFVVIPTLAQVDTTILKAGKSWVYAHTQSSRMTGTQTSGFEGITEFKIDSISTYSYSDKLLYVTQRDSGAFVPASGNNQIISKRVFRYMPDSKMFYSTAPDGGSPADGPPRFAFGGNFPLHRNWRILGADTLQYNESPVSASPGCIATSFRYLETLGMLSYSNSSHCGITSEDEEFRLLTVDGHGFRSENMKSLPMTSDFAPYQRGRYWEYDFTRVLRQDNPITASVVVTRDSLKWIFQVFDIGIAGPDSLVKMRVKVTGRRQIPENGSLMAGLAVDIEFLDSVAIRGGAVILPSVGLYDGDGIKIVRNVFEGSLQEREIDGPGNYTESIPFYISHDAYLDRLNPGWTSYDSIIDGKATTILQSGIDPASPQYGSRYLYGQGIGLIHKHYETSWVDGWSGGGNFHPTGSYVRISGDMTLVSQGISPEAIQSPPVTGKAEVGPRRAGLGSRADVLWMGARCFGVDGKSRAPVR